MDWTEILQGATYRVLPRYDKDKFSLVAELTEQVLAGKGYSRDIVQQAVDGVLRREKMRSTGIGSEIALPHTRGASVSGIHLGFFTLQEAMDFGSVDRRPVRAFFLIIASADCDRLAIQSMARVSRAMLDEDWKHNMMAASTPEVLREMIMDRWLR